MALTEELPIYKATYDLVLIIFRFTKDFNREYKKGYNKLKRGTTTYNQLLYVDHRYAWSFGFLNVHLKY
jgi:hypothetical protein